MRAGGEFHQPPAVSEDGRGKGIFMAFVVLHKQPAMWESSKKRSSFCDVPCCSAPSASLSSVLYELAVLFLSGR